jgi:hypothetical protein
MRIICRKPDVITVSQICISFDQMYQQQYDGQQYPWYIPCSPYLTMMYLLMGLIDVNPYLAIVITIRYNLRYAGLSESGWYTIY